MFLNAAFGISSARALEAGAVIASALGRFYVIIFVIIPAIFIVCIILFILTSKPDKKKKNAENYPTKSNTLVWCALGPICLAVLMGSMNIFDGILSVMMMAPVLVFIPVGAIVGILYFVRRNEPSSQLRTFSIGVCTFINAATMLLVLSILLFG
jgi:glucose uptake protein GlcU